VGMNGFVDFHNYFTLVAMQTESRHGRFIVD
jgi:hypothetical protein